MSQATPTNSGAEPRSTTQSRPYNINLIRKYTNRVNQLKKFLRCQKCSEAVMAKNFENHVHLKHRVTKFSCPWCFGQYKYQQGTKGRHMDHIYTCFENYIQSFPFVVRRFRNPSPSIILPPPTSLLTAAPVQRSILMNTLSQNEDNIITNNNSGQVLPEISNREVFKRSLLGWLNEKMELKKQLVEKDQQIQDRDKQISEMRHGMDERDGKIVKWKRKVEEMRKEKEEWQQRMLDRVSEEKNALQQQLLQQVKDRQAINYTTNV